MLCTQYPAIAGTRKARGRKCMKQQKFTVIGRDAGWQADGGRRGLDGGGEGGGGLAGSGVRKNSYQKAAATLADSKSQAERAAGTEAAFCQRH